MTAIRAPASASEILACISSRVCPGPKRSSRSRPPTCRPSSLRQEPPVRLRPPDRSGERSSRAPQKLVRRVEWSEDHFELRVVRVDDDVGRVEPEALPPVGLEPIWAFRADQGEHAAARSRPLELQDYAGIGRNAGARHVQITPTIHNRQCLEEPNANVSL